MSDKKPAPLELEFDNNTHVLELCGQHDEHLRKIEEALQVQILSKGNKFAIFGENQDVQQARIVLDDLYHVISLGMPLRSEKVEAALRLSEPEADGEKSRSTSEIIGESKAIKTFEKTITPRSKLQHHYVQDLRTKELVFGVGPAGTGKTFLATAVAVEMLMSKQIRRIVLTRPVVEAGESLGFLPGTLEEKIDPYLRPLFDALQEMLGAEKLKEYMEKGVIEVAPLAYMRGRTLSHCVMILDESQNTTTAQMRMFLTRMGENSRMIVTGDPTQCDLKRGQQSGLKESATILEGVKGVSVINFKEGDVVRHPLVARIVKAYEKNDKDDKIV